jgi:hypothetical protein
MDKKNNISKKLEEIKKENSFSVPDGYFESFQQRLQDKIRSEEDSIYDKTQYGVPRLVWLGAIAAVFIIAFFVGRNIIGTGGSQPLTQDEIALAFEQDIYDLDDFELVQNLDEVVQVENLENEYSDEIILYLLDEDIDIDKIVNEL